MCLEKIRKDYTFRRQLNEKPTIIPGCPDAVCLQSVGSQGVNHKGGRAIRGWATKDCHKGGASYSRLEDVRMCVAHRHVLCDPCAAKSIFDLLVQMASAAT